MQQQWTLLEESDKGLTVMKPVHAANTEGDREVEATPVSPRGWRWGRAWSRHWSASGQSGAGLGTTMAWVEVQTPLRVGIPLRGRVLFPVTFSYQP